jgi:hypothetical protein
MSGELVGWYQLLAMGASVFTQPSYGLFLQLACAWILCPGRRTVTHMIGLIEPQRRRRHDAYHRFLRAGAWRMSQLWCAMARKLVLLFLAKNAPVELILDDTLFHKTGRKVNGAGIFRDPVRSSVGRTVYALGLNLVVLALRIDPPWGGEPLALPIDVRLHRKGGPTLIELAVEMLKQVRELLPDRPLRLAADGAYATLAGKLPKDFHLTSRMRRDAALYDLPPRRKKGQRGRPRKKGRRLPTPAEIAARTQVGWQPVTVIERGKPVDRLVLSLIVLWYQVRGDHPVKLTLVRDPSGHQPDDFLFTTDLDAAPELVGSEYAARWAIEDTNRAVKQSLGGEQPQCWRGAGPERAAALSCWLYSATWLWYIVTHGSRKTWSTSPWFLGKVTPSFADALCALRRALWRERVFAGSARRPLPAKKAEALLEILAAAGL